MTHFFRKRQVPHAVFAHFSNRNSYKMASTSNENKALDDFSCDCEQTDEFLHLLPVCKSCSEMKCRQCFKDMVKECEQTPRLERGQPLVIDIKIRCPWCNDVSTFKELVPKYGSNVFVSKCDRCQDDFRNEDLAEHLLNSDCARFGCSFCGYECTSHEHLMHCEDLTCPMCKDSSMTFEALELHMRTHQLD